MKNKLSKISAFHYFKLAMRSALFIVCLVFYILHKSGVTHQNKFLPWIVWAFFMLGMALRFFPSEFESMGCRKQFKRNYEPVEGKSVPINQSWKQTAVVAILWLALNVAIGALYFAGIIDRGILVLISIGYSVCDVICILFFCPFQTWIMKNRCCTTCRIYNWDFAMMFTPLIFIPSLYTYSLVAFSIALLLRWEITYRTHPERFSTETNKCLDCSVCSEKLCSHKKQLQRFLKKHRAKFFPTRQGNQK